MKLRTALTLSLFATTALAQDATQLIRTRLAEAGQTNPAAIICTPDQHSGTISCRVQCANKNDLAATWEALRSLRDKVRISQGSNYVIVVMRTRQDAQQRQAINRARALQREGDRQEASVQAQQKNPEASREIERQHDLEAINKLRTSIQSAQQKTPDRGQIGLQQARIDGQEHQLAQMVAAYKGKYGQEP